MDATIILSEYVHVLRKAVRVRAERPRCPVRPVIGVLHPTVRRIEGSGYLVDCMQRPPVGARIATVRDLRVVEPVVALRDELRMEVRYLAMPAREQRVVRAVCLQARNIEEGGEILRLRPQV